MASYHLIWVTIVLIDANGRGLTVLFPVPDTPHNTMTTASAAVFFSDNDDVVQSISIRRSRNEFTDTHTHNLIAME